MSTKSKKVTFGFFPKLTVDMYVTIQHDGLKKPERFMILTSMNNTLELEIANPNPENSPKKSNMITIHVTPCRLVDYLTQPEESRRHYNFNSEFDRDIDQANGEERLMQALTLSAEYSYDSIKEHVPLQNPMKILHDLLGCTC